MRKRRLATGRIKDFKLSKWMSMFIALIIWYCVFYYAIGYEFERDVFISGNVHVSINELNAVVGDNLWVSVSVIRDNYEYEWNDYEILCDGFSGEIEIGDSSSYGTLFFKINDIVSTDNSTSKRMNFILYENQEKPITVVVPFKLYSNEGFFVAYLMKTIIIVLVFAITMRLKQIQKCGKQLFYILYNLTCMPILAVYISSNLRVNPNEGVCIALCTAFIIFAVLSLNFGKTIFKNTTYTFIIVCISTYLLCQLSYIFTSYYYQAYFFNDDSFVYDKYRTYYSVGLSLDMRHRFYAALKYSAYSFRYFFEFQEEEMYDLVSVYQFMLGKLYELVVFGSAANFILKLIKTKESMDQ